MQEMVPWWRWYYYINPVSWTLYAIIVTQLGDDTHVVSLPPPKQCDPPHERLAFTKSLW